MIELVLKLVGVSLLVVVALAIPVGAVVVATYWLNHTRKGMVVRAVYRFVRFLGYLVSAAMVMLGVVAWRVGVAVRRRQMFSVTGLVLTLVAPEVWRWRARKASAQLRDEPGRVSRARGYKPTASGGIYTVRLPAGVTWKALDHEVTASAFHALDAVVSKGDRADSATVRLRYRDLLRKPIPAPMPEWTGHRVTIGVTADGDPLVLDMDQAHTAVAGTTGAGKSNVVHLICAHYAAHPKARLFILDGKDGAELVAWERRADAFDDGTGEHFEEIVRGVVAEIGRRYKANAAASRAAIAQGRYGERDYRRSAEDEHPPILVVIDEAASYAARSDAFVELMRVVMQKGRAVGVRVVLSTQKATRDSVPSLLRDLCDIRVGLKAGSDEMGDAILGRPHGALAADLPSPSEDQERDAGRCYVVRSDRAILGRAFLASPAWLAAASAPPTAGAPSVPGGDEGAPASARAHGGEAGARARTPATDDATDRDARPRRASGSPLRLVESTATRGRRADKRANRRGHRAAQAARDAARLRGEGEGGGAA